MPIESVVLHRHPRALFSFGRMIWRMTERCPLDYNSYGNWCGYGGGPEDPVDNIDK